MSAVLKIPGANLYLLIGDQRHGPFTLDQIQSKYATGEIARGTYLWYPSLANWITVGDIPSIDRRDAPTPSEKPAAPSEEEKVWIYEKEQVISIAVETLVAQVRDNHFRRADLVFDEPSNQWMRADQHPIVARLFRPAVPPPILPALAAAAPVAPTVAYKANAQSTLKKSGHSDGLTPFSEEDEDLDITVTGVTSSPTAVASSKSAPPPLKTVTTTPKTSGFSWVYPGVGFAGAALALWFGYGFFNSSPQSRLPASISEVSNEALRLVFPVGAPLKSVSTTQEFRTCKTVDKVSDMVVYECTGLNSAFYRFRMLVRNDKIFRITATFLPVVTGKDYLDALVKTYGNPATKRNVGCDALTPTERSMYAQRCKGNGIVLAEWKSPVHTARVLSFTTDGGEKPLEATVESLQ